MANLNEVRLIGRLTRDPEIRTFANGGKVANFGFCVNKRVKNTQTGEWEDKPVWIDCKAFDRESGRKLASLIEQYVKKGHQLYVGGHLDLDQWEDKTTGQKRQALRVIVDDVQFLEKKPDDGNGGGNTGYQKPATNAPAKQPARQPSRPAPADDGGYSGPSTGGGYDDDIPF